MAGFDKWHIMEILKRYGWTKVEPDDPHSYDMVPPDSLWENKGAFHVYDARALQALLGEWDEEAAT